jgi:RNA polymerase sigma factor
VCIGDDTLSTLRNQESGENRNKDSFLSYLTKIRQGDFCLREEFIRANKHFISNIICRTLDISSISESSDEFGIGLSAFNFSIDNFNLNGKTSFYVYSERIIKDWIFSHLSDETVSNNLTSNDSYKDYMYRKYEDKEEISLFKNRLWEYGITLRDLYFLSPRDIDSIRSCLKLASKINKSDLLFEKFISEKSLPIDELYEKNKNKYNKKFIEKNKEYITALSLIIKSNLKILQSYLKNIETGRENTDNIGVILELYKKEAIVMNFQGQLNIVKIKNNNLKNMGKQIFLDTEGTNNNSKKLLWYSLAAGSAVAVLLLAVFINYTIFNNVGNVTPGNADNIQAYNDKPTQLQQKEDAYNPPTLQNNHIVYESPSPKVTEPIGVIVSSAPAIVKPSTDTPVKAVSSPGKPQKPKSSPKKDLPSKSAIKLTEPSAIPQPAAMPSIIKDTLDEATEKVGKATGIPGPVELKAIENDMGEHGSFTLIMSMPGGNNGTLLTLYENGIPIETITLPDDTPNPQIRKIHLKKGKGKYTYDFKLENSFGSIWSNQTKVLIN